LNAFGALRASLEAFTLLQVCHIVWKERKVITYNKKKQIISYVLEGSEPTLMPKISLSSLILKAIDTLIEI
jgi:hypothetical protein